MFSITVFSGSALPKKMVMLMDLVTSDCIKCGHTCEMPEIYIFEETLDKTFFLNVCFCIFQLSLGKSLSQYLGINKVKKAYKNISR